MRKLRLKEVGKYAHGHQADNQWSWEHEPREGDRLFCSHYTRWPLFFLICELTQFYLSGSWQGSLACCSPWGCKESDTTEQLNWSELNWDDMISSCNVDILSTMLELWVPSKSSILTGSHPFRCHLQVLDYSVGCEPLWCYFGLLGLCWYCQQHSFSTWGKKNPTWAAFSC